VPQALCLKICCFKTLILYKVSRGGCLIAQDQTLHLAQAGILVGIRNCTKLINQCWVGIRSGRFWGQFFDFITLVVKVQKADSDKVIVVLKFSMNQSNNLKTIGSFCALSKNCQFFEGFGKTTTRNFFKIPKIFKKQNQITTQHWCQLS
jgi:hypothetical protein